MQLEPRWNEPKCRLSQDELVHGVAHEGFAYDSGFKFKYRA